MSPETRRRNRSSSYSFYESSTCVFDLFFDIPHPAASPASCERAKIIEPPGKIHPDVCELYHPSKISKIPKFAFPDFDENNYNVPRGVHSEFSTSAILNKFDVNCFTSNLVHHTFALLLDSGTRVHAHVLRYLPTHTDIKTRYDVGRRSERAMVLFTRAVGGIKFYSCLLRTLQAVQMEKRALPPMYMGNHDFMKAFLHTIYKRHLLLKKRYFDNILNHDFKIVQKVLHDEYTKITIQGAELYFLLPHTPESIKDRESYHGNIIGNGDGLHYFRKHDYMSFHLPISLQPGYHPDNFLYEYDDIHSPILPLLRCLGTAKTIRVLSALLCEHRIIYISKSTEILSACVTASSAMLAQGLLVWRHVQIPVLPPHLLRFLTSDSPFIVGVLDKYCESVERLSGLRDALYIDLDNGLLKTLYMPDAQQRVPDLLLRRKKKNHLAIDELANDFALVLEKEKEVWESIDMNVEESEELLRDSISSIKKSFSSYFFSKEEKEKEEKEKEDKNNDFFQQAGMFVKNFLPQNIAEKDDDSTEENDSLPEERVVDVHLGSEEESNRRYCAYILSNNDKGEEVARASLVCLFLEIFGDMGMFLTMDRLNNGGKFKVDVNKFLHRKRQMGVRQDAPMYVLLRQLTRSTMFETYAKARIDELERKSSSRSGSLLINHTPLFSLCQKHIGAQRTKFNTQNIRKVVFTTIAGSPDRILVDSLEQVRERALALTSEKPFEGNEVVALTTLIDVCKGCSQSFTQVMQVVWMRIREYRPSLWKRPLLGLHLLRNFLLHGPIATLSSSLVELERIRNLMNYRCRLEENEIRVQTAARQVYALLKNLCRLFLRRRKVMALKVKSEENISDNVIWSSYLIRRLPGTMSFDQIHEFMKPPDGALPQHFVKKELKEMLNRVNVPDEMDLINRERSTRRSSIPPQQVLDAEYDSKRNIHSRVESKRLLTEKNSREFLKNVRDITTEQSKRDFIKKDENVNLIVGRSRFTSDQFERKSLKELFEENGVENTSAVGRPRSKSGDDFTENKSHDEYRMGRRSSIPPTQSMQLVGTISRFGPITKSQRMHRDMDDDDDRESPRHFMTRDRIGSSDYSSARGQSSKVYREGNFFDGKQHFGVHSDNYKITFEGLECLEEVKL